MVIPQLGCSGHLRPRHLLDRAVIIGAVISAIGIQHTMFVPAVLLTGLIVLARVMPDTAAPTDSAVESAP